MAVTNDYLCAAHGPFEAQSDRCPHCKHNRFVKIQFLKAPAFTSAKTKNSDRVVKQLAMDYRMTDVKNDKDGGSVMDAMRKGNRTPAMAPGQVMQNYRQNPTRESAWLGSAPPTAFGGLGGNALSGVPMGKPRPQYVARDAGEYRK
jgi:hypothetical protein